MTTLKFKISLNNGDELLWLPVNPETLSVMTAGGYEDITVTQIGERSVFSGDRLREFSLSSFFPRDYNASYCEYSPVPNPWNAVNRIDRWRREGRVVRLNIEGTTINVIATIRSFSYEERAGNPGDLFYELSLKEYVPVTFKKYSEKTAEKTTFTESSASTARTGSKEIPDSYTVKSGDSLFKISQRVYQDGDKWRTIYNANKTAIGKNPSVLKAGMKLVIPK